MKPLAIWLAFVAVVFGVYAAVAASLQETERVFVFVDTSQPMELLDSEIVLELDRLDDRDDAEFALARGQDRGSELVHSWQPEFRWSTTPLFAPCSFAEIDAFTEAADADDKILITTAGSCDTSALADWEIIELIP